MNAQMIWRAMLSVLFAGLTMLVACQSSTTNPVDPSLSAMQDIEANLSKRQANQLRLFRDTLQNPSEDISAETRRLAASELIALDIEPGYVALRQALATDQVAIFEAVLEAMRAAPQPVQPLREATVAALRTPPEGMMNPLVAAVGRFGQPALHLVTTLARNQNLPVAERFGAILALGSFPNQTSGDVLIELTNPLRQEQQAVQVAAFASLRKLSGLDFSSDHEAWRIWWSSAREKSREDWARERIDQLTEQLASTQQAKQALSIRLTDLLRDHYRTLSLEQQLDRLPADLADTMPEVRDCAVHRIERLRRDQVRIPRSTQDALADRLTDDLPALRALAAQLLAEMGYPGIESHIAAAFADELHPLVLAAFLDVIASRPTVEAVEAIRGLLNHSTVSASASNAAWSLCRAGMLSEEQRIIFRDTARLAQRASSNPPQIRLLALIGDEDDAVRLEQLLDQGEDAQREAVAEAFRYRPRHAALYLHADDPLVFPFAVGSLSDGQATLEHLRTLVELTPPEGQAVVWAAAVKTMSDALAPKDLTAADDILSGSPIVTSDLRASMLQRVVDLPPESIDSEQRTLLLVRLAVIYLELDLPQTAWTILNTINITAESPDLKPLRFRIAILIGEFDRAVEIEPDAIAWIELFDELSETKTDTAKLLRDEIKQRFESQLVGKVKDQFDKASARLNQTGASAPTTTPGGENSS